MPHTSVTHNVIPTNPLLMTLPSSRESTRDSVLSSEIDLYGHRTRRLSTKDYFIFYTHRWYVLAVICLLALSNAAIWLSYTNISKLTIPFYCQISSETTDKPSSCDISFWSSQIFQMVGLLTGVLGMYITDKHGIKLSCILGCLFNAMGAFLRVISSMPIISFNSRLPLMYLGQTLAAMAQPFFLCLSPKVAEYWFGDHQRAFANSLSFSANPIGVAIGTLIPNFVITKNETDEEQNSNQLFILNMILFIITFTTAILSFFIKSNKPPTPPSPSSAADHSPDFVKGIKILFCNPMFYVQLITFGVAFATQWSFPVFAEQMLAEIGYSTISSYLVVLSAIAGTIGSIVAGHYIDKTKNFKGFIITSYITIAVLTICINFHIRQPYYGLEQTTSAHIWICILVIALGYATIPVFPIGLELCVETTYPVAEATSSGILVITGQFQLFLLTFIMQYLHSKTWFYHESLELYHNNNKIFENHSNISNTIKYDSSCKEKYLTQNYLLTIDFWCFFAVFGALFSTIFLKPRYLRLEYELEESLKTKCSKKSIINKEIKPLTSVIHD
uniref:MFS domain-containing protein n=1 Tax=Parastrongyloides trichosuri TaxID=131310 RepID=A0A0N5A4R0_PARTI